LAGKRIVWGQTFASLGYVNDYYQAIAGDPATALSHTWSLGIEEQFYLVAPAVFLALYRRGTLARRLVVAIGCVWIYRWILVATGAPQHYIYSAFDTRADQLLVGCLLAVALRGRFATRTWSALCAHAALPALSFGALALSAALAYRFGPTYRDAVGFVVDPLLVAVLIVQLIAWSHRAPWSWLNRPAIRYLGRISYSIYLYQQIVPTLVDGALRRQPFLVRLAATLIGVTLVASASYWFVERPFLRLKERLGRQAHESANPVVAPLPATVP
jgi:peptidoglycan/LPS O-acetylase OafA/YrhL